MESGTTAQAMMLTEPRHFSFTDVVTQEVEDGGWLAVEATGISGSDVQVWKGEAQDVVYPLVPGREVRGAYRDARAKRPLFSRHAGCCGTENQMWPLPSLSSKPGQLFQPQTCQLLRHDPLYRTPRSLGRPR